MILYFISSGGQTLKTDFNNPPNVCLSVNISILRSLILPSIYMELNRPFCFENTQDQGLIWDT